MAKKRDPLAGFDVDAAMKAEGLSLDGFDVNRAMADEGIHAQEGPWKTGYVKPDAGPRLPDRASLPENQPPEPSFWEKLKGGAENALHSSADAIDRGGDVVGGFMEGVNRKASMGLIPIAERALGYRDVSEGMASRHPDANQIGEGTGLGLSAVVGPGKLAGNAATETVAALAPRLIARGAGKGFGGVAARVAASGLEGGVAGAGMGAAEDGVDGAVTGGLFGAAGGSAVRAIGEAGNGLAKLFRKIPWVDRYASAASGGPRDITLHDGTVVKGAGDPSRLDEARADVKSGAIPKGKEGIQRASERARDEVFARDAEITGEARQRHGNVRKTVGDRTADLEPAVDSLADLQGTTRYSKGDTISDRANISDAVDQTFDDLTRKGPQGRTVEDLAQAREAAGEAAGFGVQNPTEAQVGKQKVYGALRDSIRKSAPELGAADDAYTDFKRGQARRNDFLTRTEAGARPVELPKHTDDALEAAGDAVPLKLRVPDEIKVASTLARHGDDTMEGLRLSPYFKELGEQDPAFLQTLKRLEAQKALEAARPALSPPEQMNLTKAVAWPMRLLGQNARSLAAHAGVPMAEGVEIAGSALANPAASLFGRIRAAAEAEERRKRARGE